MRTISGVLPEGTEQAGHASPKTTKGPAPATTRQWCAKCGSPAIRRLGAPQPPAEQQRDDRGVDVRSAGGRRRGLEPTAAALARGEHQLAGLVVGQRAGLARRRPGLPGVLAGDAAQRVGDDRRLRRVRPAGGAAGRPPRRRRAGPRLRPRRRGRGHRRRGGRARRPGRAGAIVARIPPDHKVGSVRGGVVGVVRGGPPYLREQSRSAIPSVFQAPREQTICWVPPRASIRSRTRTSGTKCAIRTFSGSPLWA